jgi:hypothetical protein
MVFAAPRVDCAIIISVFSLLRMNSCETINKCELNFIPERCDVQPQNRYETSNKTKLSYTLIYSHVLLYTVFYGNCISTAPMINFNVAVTCRLLAKTA